MGKSTRKKQQKAEIKEQQVAQVLSSHSTENKARGMIDGDKVVTDIIRTHHEKYLRDFTLWQYSGKSRKPEKQRLELVRYLFGQYPVPRFLEQAIISDDTNTDSPFAKWYIVATQGGSLYKECTRNILSKKETHLFLQAPNHLTIKEAIWWAKSMSLCDDIGVSSRVARSGIARRGNYEDKFWLDVHRFFTYNPVPIKEMDDLLDYIMFEHRESDNWTITKRSLEAVRRKSEQWHRALRKMRIIGGGSWDGMDIPNWKLVSGKFDPNPQKNTKIEWHICEILTGSDLAREGHQMHHCVASYKRPCMEGQSAIFSMYNNTATRMNRKLLTFEVEVSARRIVQARGFANRDPRNVEIQVLYKWCSANRIRPYTGY